MQTSFLRWHCLLALLLVTSLSVTSARLQHATSLDPEGSMAISWTPDPANNQITIRVEARTRGWAAVGFSPNGAMKNSDIIMGWVKDGKVHVQDMHAVGNQVPVADDRSDIEVLGGSENGTHTVFTFKRHLKPCDTKHDMEIGMDTSRVIWAWNAEDPDTPSSPRYHQSNRGVRSISLDGSGIFQYPDPEVTEYFEIRSPNVELPSKHTLYHCSMKKIPDFGQKVHYTGFQVVLEPATAAYVHHVVAYECVVPESMHEILDEHVRSHPGTECYTPNMPKEWNYCKHIMIAWAVGGEGDMLPENVGMPLGHQYGSATYLMVETHYDNPRLHSGMRDNSGLRLFYTRSLRPVEAGLVTLGHAVTSTQFIPPDQKHFISGGVCLGACTEKYFPEEGVTLHSVMLHAHLAGRKINLRHIRNGKELTPIAIDNTYDFNYQQARVLDSNVRILPGDALILDCDYNTEGRDRVTMGGFSTRNEMCLAFLTYYPRTELTLCTSRPHLGRIMKSVGIDNVVLSGKNFPAVLGGGLWHHYGTEFEKNRLKQAMASNITAKEPADKRAKPRDDSLNEAELSTIEVDMGEGKSKTSLYNYMVKMSWTQDRVNSLQNLITGGDVMLSCYTRQNPVGLTGPEDYPEFETYKPPEGHVCAQRLTTSGSQHHLPAQLPTIVSLTALFFQFLH